MKTVFLVDDDIDYLFQMKSHLEKAGYLVKSAESLKEAETALKDFKPDISVIDLMMENTDSGFTLAHKIKQIDSTIPVIMITAVTSETGMAFDSAADGASDWIKADTVLAKPVRFEQLIREISRLLEN